MLRKLLAVATLFALSLTSYGQSGTDFWFAPPEVTDLHNPPGAVPIYLLVSTYAQPATVTISQPANGAFTPIVVNLNANSTSRINLSAFKTSLETEPTNTVLNTGLRIQATNTIVAYYEVSNSNNTDIFALKGANGLGKEFYIPLHKHAPFYNHTFANPHEAYASFDIVATQNNTTVTIYSPVAMDGRPALTQFSITLNAGQTYSGAWTGTNYTQPSTHPSGAVVLSDKPIAVSVKDDSNHNPSGGCYDLMGDQIVPVDILGTDYIAVKGGLNPTGDESVFITATQNNTQVFIDGAAVPVVTLFAGETYRVDMDYLAPGPNNSVYVRTSKPAYAMHVTGFGCEMGQAILPPLNCAGSQQVSFVRSTNESFFLTLLVRAAAVNSFAINGPGTATINPGSFITVPGTGGQWMAARIQYNTTQIPTDSTFLVTNSQDVFALGIINGGGSTGCRYGFFSEFAADVNVNAGPDQTMCANNVVLLNGNIAGGTTTGVWTTSGSGTFTPSATTLNATYNFSAVDTTNGSVTLYLTSTGSCNPIMDSMVVTITPAPVVEAGPALVSCGRDSVQLAGSVTGGATTGLWSTTGSGVFVPNAAVLNAKYVPSVADVSSGTIKLYLVSTANGTCIAENDSTTLTLTPEPVVFAGNDTTLCSSTSLLPLNGSVSGGTTTGQWSNTGTGSFSPINTALNATYVFTSADTAAGSIWIKLTSTNNGGCAAEADSFRVTFSKSPTANAGTNTTVCANNAAVNLNGAVTNTSGGTWSTSGTGTFAPSATLLNATYNPSAADIANGSVILRLTTSSTSLCPPVYDSIIVTITPRPVVNAGNDTSLCVTNLNLQLAGSVTGGSTTGQWSTTGTGTFSPSNTALNATYQVSSQDSANGVVFLILTSTNNGNCLPEDDTIRVTILPAGIANAGTDLTTCANVPVNLSGVVSGSATTGFWTTLGSGSFSPSNTTLNATYIPSAADTAAGSVKLVLTANSCNQSKDTVTITFTPAPVANAGADDNVCANAPNFQLNGAVFLATGGTWSGGSGTFNPSNNVLNPVYTPTAGEISAGFVNLILTTTGNGSCNASTDTMRLTITAPPTVNAGIDQTVCKQAAMTQLQGVVTGGSSTGQWSSSGTGSFSPNNNILNGFYTFSPSDTANGFVWIYLISTNNGKCSAVRDSMLITFSNSAFASAGPDIYVCENNLNAVLSGFVTGGSTTGQWSTLGTGTFSPNNTTLNATYQLSSADSAAGQVTLVLQSTNNGSCQPGFDTVNVFVQQEHVAIAGNNIVACPSRNVISLIGQVQNSLGGKWTTTGSGFFSPSDTNLIVSYVPSAQDSAAGFFQLILTTKFNGACAVTSDTITVTMVNDLVADFEFSNACDGQAVSFTDSSTSATGTVNYWEWSFGDGIKGFQQNENHIYPSVGTYNVTLLVKTDKGCLDTVIKNVEIYPSPVASFTTAGSTFQPDEDIKFTNTSTGYIGSLWNFGDSVGTSTSQNPIYTYTGSGNYTVTLVVTNTYGCKDSTSADLVIEPLEDEIHDPELPTAFTPNGDGLNDILYVRGGPFKSLFFNVYNEWGQLMFTSESQNDGWDGSFQGKPSQVGVYVYTVEAITEDDKEYKFNGEVKLLR